MWWLPTIFVVLLIFPGFIQKVIQDVSLVLFIAAPLSSRLLVHSFYCWTVTIASYVWNLLFVSRGCGYVWANHSTDLPYDEFVITIVERNNWEVSLVHRLRYCYSCFALVTVLSNQLVIFPGITLYYGTCNYYILSTIGGSNVSPVV